MAERFFKKDILNCKLVTQVAQLMESKHNEKVITGNKYFGSIIHQLERNCEVLLSAVFTGPHHQPHIT